MSEDEQNTLQDEINHSCPRCEEPMELSSIDPVEDEIYYYCSHCQQYWKRKLGN
jgi:formamidopyrimidine-DNA glycosylase